MNAYKNLLLFQASRMTSGSHSIYTERCICTLALKCNISSLSTAIVPFKGFSPSTISLHHRNNRRLHRSLSPSSTSFFSTKKSSSPCPYKTLSIPKKSKYSQAKKTFLQIAMKNHPDTIHQHISKDDEMYNEKIAQSVELFRRARVAFEALVEDDDGFCVLRVDVETQEEIKKTMNNDQFE